MAADSPRAFSPDWLSLRSKIQEIFNRSRVFREVHITGPEADRDGRVSAEVGFGREPAFIRIIAPSAETVWAVLFEVAWGIVEADGSVPFWASGAKAESERERLPSRGRK